MGRNASDRILFELKTRGPQAASAIARRLAVTPMAVRQHLYRLNRMGLVDCHDERRPVGRPARIWQLTDKAQSRFPDSHAELTLEMLAAVKAIFGEDGMSRLLAARAQEQIELYRTRLNRAGVGLERRVPELAKIRAEQGYMAQVSRERDGSWVLLENHCPICDAATAHPELCHEELKLFRSLLGRKVEVERVEHITDGARRCAYRITPDTGASRRR